MGFISGTNYVLAIIGGWWVLTMALRVLFKVY